MTNVDPVDQVFEAIELGDTDTLRSLLTKNPELAHYDNVGTTLLHYAAEYDSMTYTSPDEHNADTKRSNRDEQCEPPPRRSGSVLESSGPAFSADLARKCRQ